MSVEATPEARPVPEAGVDASPEGWRRRRWLRRTVLTLVLALALAVAGGLVWTQHYQPLEVGGGPIDVVSNDVRVVDESNVLGAQYTVVRPTGGDTATARTMIYVGLDAPFGVTIEDVGIPDWLVGDPTHAGFLDSVDVEMRRMPPLGEQPLVPFTPVTLGPGDSLELHLSMTFATCNRPSPGSMTWRTSVPLTYSALGMTHHIEMPLGYALALRGIAPCGVS